jgi:hypothetical protein
MKKSVFIVLFFCLCVTSTLHADVHVKQVVHRDEFYDGGVVTPASDIEIEMWFGGKRMAYHGADWIGIIDAGSSLLYFANKRDSVYFEIPLPAVEKNHVSEELGQTLGQYFVDGSVESEQAEKTILERRCKCFTCKDDITFEDLHFYDREKTVWITEDVPFDWTLWNDMRNVIRGFFNPREQYSKQLERLSGFELAEESKRYDRGNIVVSNTGVVEITKREAPEGVYSVPEGFTRKEEFERNEIISLRSIIYIF